MCTVYYAPDRSRSIPKRLVTSSTLQVCVCCLILLICLQNQIHINEEDNQFHLMNRK